MGFSSLVLKCGRHQSRLLLARPAHKGADSDAGGAMARRWMALGMGIGATVLSIWLTASPVAACAGLVTPGGNVKLVRTGTLAAYHAGVEHYVTSFKFEGG